MIEAKLSSLHGITPTEHALRFLFGGIAVVVTGLIANQFGPVVGGLFLAFPAIFPASANLIEKHQKQKKARIHRDGTGRGRAAAALDATGAICGAVGLIFFAFTLWKLLPAHGAACAFSVASLVWLVASTALWFLHRKL